MQVVHFKVCGHYGQLYISTFSYLNKIVDLKFKYRYCFIFFEVYHKELQGGIRRRGSEQSTLPQQSSSFQGGMS